jgi:hypothetical protein
MTPRVRMTENKGDTESYFIIIYANNTGAKVKPWLISRKGKSSSALYLQ